MTHRLATNCAKNYCNRTPVVRVIVENVVTCFFWDTVYVFANHLTMLSKSAIMYYNIWTNHPHGNGAVAASCQWLTNIDTQILPVFSRIAHSVEK